jgi:hypothetical protein
MQMKNILLASVLLLATSPQALAACSGNVTIGNIVWISGCSSDNQANDGDDIKMFVDKARVTVDTIDGSLGSNNQAFDNIVSNANAGATFETDGSGFANFKSHLAGSTSNNLTAYTFTPWPSATLPDGTPFPGFDGQLFRGQIDNLGAFNGDINVTINFFSGPSVSHTFTGIGTTKDFGVLGFDELMDPGSLISSVVIGAGTGGAWNEFKQIEFSVPGAIAVIPEPSTWVMALLGFAGMAGYGAWRKTAHKRANGVRSVSDNVAFNS